MVLATNTINFKAKYSMLLLIRIQPLHANRQISLVISEIIQHRRTELKTISKYFFTDYLKRL